MMKGTLPMSILKASYYVFFCCLVGFFRWTIQAQPHFWPWHACLNQALHERNDLQSERVDAYSLTRRNYQERLQPLILGINCRTENQTQKCSWRAWLSMTAAFLFQTTARTLQFAFIVLCIFLMLWLILHGQRRTSSSSSHHRGSSQLLVPVFWVSADVGSHQCVCWCWFVCLGLPTQLCGCILEKCNRSQIFGKQLQLLPQSCATRKPLQTLTDISLMESHWEKAGNHTVLSKDFICRGKYEEQMFSLIRFHHKFPPRSCCSLRWHAPSSCGTFFKCTPSQVIAVGPSYTFSADQGKP